MWRKTTFYDAMIYTDDRGWSESEVYNHSIYINYEVVFLHNSDFTPHPPFFWEILFFSEENLQTIHIETIKVV